MPGEVAAPPPPTGAPPAGAQPPAGAAAGTPPAGAPAPPPDPFEELLKKQPLVLKNKSGKEVKIGDRKALDHYLGKGFGSHEAFEKANRLEGELKKRDELLARLEAGDEMSVELLREVYGPKWRQIVQREALRDFEEEEKYKNIPPEIREKIEENKRLQAEKRQLEEKTKRAEADQQQRAELARLEAARADFQRVGMPALKKLGFPEKPPAPVIRRLAEYLAENVDLAAERGVDELAPEVVADALKADMQAEYKALAQAFVGSNDGAGLVAWLGEDVVNCIRRFDLARLRGAAAGGTPPTAPTPGAGDSVDEMKKFWR